MSTTTAVVADQVNDEDPQKLVSDLIGKMLARQRGWRGLSREDREDATQIAHMACFIHWGRNYPVLLAEALSDELSANHVEIKHCLYRITSKSIGEVRGTRDKRKQRGLPQETASSHEPALLETFETESEPSDTERDWCLDLDNGFGNVGPEARRIWDEMTRGKSPRQIASKLGMTRYHVSKYCDKLVKAFAEYIT